MTTKTASLDDSRSIRVFISYAWEDDDYRLLVKQLATRLREDGIDARLDAWHVRGLSIPEFMNREVRNADRVLVLCSPGYRRKVHAMEDSGLASGVGWEDMLVTGALFYNALARDQVIAALLRGDWKDSAPDFLRSHLFVDLSEESSFEENYRALLRELCGRVEPAPPLGHLPADIDPDPVEPLRGSTRHCSFVWHRRADRATTHRRPSNGIAVLDSPDVWNYVCDRASLRLHGLLRTLNVVPTPAEYADVTAYLRELRANLENDITQKTYIPNIAKGVPRVPHAENEGSDPFVQPIHQVVREILGRSEGGDSASAQLAAVNRKSRVVRNLIRTLLAAFEPLILLGDPGTGKTMTLQQVALSLVTSELRRVFPTVTVYVRLGEFHVEGPVTTRHVLDYVKQSVPETIQHYIDELDTAGRLIVLFDGMDEMSRGGYTEHTEALSKFAAARRGRTKTLFSCRITDFSPRFTHQRLVLLPFDRAQILEYLRRYFIARVVLIEGKSWNLRALSKRLTQGGFSVDATNPFVLWLLCFHLAQKQAWPRSRVDLLGFYLEETYRRKQEDLDLALVFLPYEQALRHWAEYAFIITDRNLGTAISVTDLTKSTIQSGQVEPIVRLGRRCGVLAETSESHAHQVRFDHHRLQEYFTALHIRKARPPVVWLDKLDAPRWQETLVNLVLMDGGEEAVSVLARAIDETITVQREAWLAYEREKQRREEEKDQSNKDQTQLDGEKQPSGDHVKQSEPAENRTRAEEEQSSATNGEEIENNARSDSSESEEPDLVEPTLTDSEETVLADRVELTARIGREASWVPVVETVLLPMLRNAVDFLTQRGNPITQVKMIRACMHLPDAELLEAARRPMTSEVGWVRDQALILLSANDRGLGANLPMEIGYDLVDGTLLTRLPAYIKAIGSSHQRGAVTSLCVAIFCALLNVALLLLMATGIYWGTLQAVGMFPTGWWTEIAKELKQPLALAIMAVLVASASGFTFVKKPEALWIAVLGCPLALLGVVFLAGGVWQGEANALVILLGWYGVVMLCSLETLLLVMVAIFPGTLLYVALTARVRPQGVGVDSLLHQAWQNCWSTWDNDLLKLSLGAHALGLIILLNIKFAIIKWVTLGLLGLLLSFVAIVGLVGLVRGVPGFFRGIQRFFHDDTFRANVLFRAGFVLVVLVVSVGIVKVLPLILKTFGLYIARIVIGIIIVVVLALYVMLVVRLIRWLAYVTRRRPFPPGTFTVDQWKELVNSADSNRQEDLLFRTHHQSLSLTPQQFLEILRDVSSFVKEEPALSTYWEHRAELEQMLKQEQRG